MKSIKFLRALLPLSNMIFTSAFLPLLLNCGKANETELSTEDNYYRSSFSDTELQSVTNYADKNGPNTPDSVASTKKGVCPTAPEESLYVCSNSKTTCCPEGSIATCHLEPTKADDDKWPNWKPGRGLLFQACQLQDQSVKCGADQNEFQCPGIRKNKGKVVPNNNYIKCCNQDQQPVCSDDRDKVKCEDIPGAGTVTLPNGTVINDSPSAAEIVAGMGERHILEGLYSNKLQPTVAGKNGNQLASTKFAIGIQTGAVIASHVKAWCETISIVNRVPVKLNKVACIERVAISCARWLLPQQERSGKPARKATAGEIAAYKACETSGAAACGAFCIN